jgi:hypothetical protein
MRKSFLLCWAFLSAVASFCVVSQASAINGTINFAHQDCLADGGVQTRNTDCVTSNFAHYMVPEFTLDGSMTQFVGVEIVFDLIDESNVSDMGPWWQWDAVGCRSGGLSVLFDPTLNPDFSNATCQDVWATSNFGPSGAIGALSRPSTSGLPVNSERVIVGIAVRSDDPLNLTSGTPYVPATLRARATSAQTTACSGCGDQIVMAFNSILVAQLPNAPGGDAYISAPSQANAQCITFNQPQSSCIGDVVPTRNRTWGQVKSLYR